ncbi:EF-hand domain-containing protein [Roseibium sp. RKSG952]|uniref:EF-hand domain-containing protein n=1 Tax=Roseibium sp. RKSG952 TaxID=2529384 RepID=UPI0012BD696C|nr:EF-hand domain-containing protein [Roseibium sp. RKSG952]MTH98382.1 calcium-binding protein [Roseibium sp. RKSG952]
MTRVKKIAAAAMAALIAGTALSSSLVSAQAQTPADGPQTQQMAHKGPGKDRDGRRGGPERMQRLFERFDINNEGGFSQKDVDTVIAQDFAKADTTGSGTLTLDEFKAFFKGQSKDRQVRAFQRMDRNGDGTVTKEDFVEITDQMFNRMDRNGDGELTRVGRGGPAAQDGNAAKQSDGQKGEKRGERGGPRKHEGRGPGPHGPRGEMRAMFRYLDADNNGTVTRAEFEQQRDALYALADPDNTGSFQLEGFSNIWMKVNDHRVVRMFQRLDKNGNLEITEQEFAAPYSNIVERLDRNHDGLVTKADFKGGKKGKRHGHREHHRGGKPGQMRQAPEAPGDLPPPPAQQG